jgi:TPR repeat protein
MIDIVNASIAIIRSIIQVREQIRYNKKQCHRLIDRLARLVPMIENWRTNHLADMSSEKGKYYSKVFTKFYDFLIEVQYFLQKFIDKNYLKKVFQRNIDSQAFDDYNTDLQQYVQDLQLGLTFNLKECQEEDFADRQEDVLEVRSLFRSLSDNNQHMMDTFVAQTESILSQMRMYVDHMSPSTSLKSTASTSSNVTDLDEIEEKIESISTEDSTKLSGKSKYADMLNDLRLVKVSDLEGNFSSRDCFIGSGSYGDVYRGRYQGKKVAVKVLKDNTAIAVNAIKKEALIMQVLSAHKNIISFYGIQIDQKPFQLVMELAQCSLYDLLYDETQPTKIGKDDLTRKLRVLYDIAQGLEFLHTVKVIHRDIKPMNVMQGADNTMKLTDFGSAKIKDIGASTNGLAKGTPAYMPPEIMLADDPDQIVYNEAADIYSMGIMMNEILDHTKPFDGLKPVNIIRALDKGTRPKIFKADEDLQATGDGIVFDLQIIIERSWHETMEKRPSATAIAKKLARLGGFKYTPPAASTNRQQPAPSSPKPAASTTSLPTPPKPTNTTSTASSATSSFKATTPPPAPAPASVKATAPAVSTAKSTAESSYPTLYREAARLDPQSNFSTTSTRAATTATVSAPTASTVRATPAAPTNASKQAAHMDDYDRAFKVYQPIRFQYNFERISELQGLITAGNVWAKALILLLRVNDGCKAALSNIEIVQNAYGNDVIKGMRDVLALGNHSVLTSYANYFLGLTLEYGFGTTVAKNAAKAFTDHYMPAALAGYSIAQNTVGLCYDHGNGVTKDTTKAFSWFSKAADAGYPPSLHNIAHCLRNGDGCTKSLPKAIEYYERAVAINYVDSMVNLGLIYQDAADEGVPKNQRKAVELFRRGVTHNCPAAQTNLGQCYEKGDGVGKNMTEAVRLYRLAAAQERPGALYYLAVCYDTGNGVTKEKGEAKRLYERAAAKEDEDAVFVLKEERLYDQAYDLFKRIRFHYELTLYRDLEKAFNNEGNVYAAGFLMQLHCTTCIVNALHLSTSVAQRFGSSVQAHMTDRSKYHHPIISAYAKYFLGLMYEQGYGVTKDERKAFTEYFLPAGESGFDIAQNAVALCYTLGSGVPKNGELSFPWYIKSADQGYAQAQHNLAYGYENGLGVPKNLTKAIEYYTKAYNQGHLTSTLNLGYCYEYGIGVTANINRAVELYRLAADKGEAQAQYNLAICYGEGTGVTKDKNMAKKYYQLAAAQNHEEAKEQMKKCVIC